MSPKRLDRYVSEFAGRHNNRGFDVADRFSVMVDAMFNKTLTWNQITARRWDHCIQVKLG